MNDRLFIIILLFTLISLKSYAVTLTVCASGCDHSTITAALAAASSGDIIAIQEAIHTEDNISITKNITIKGQGQTSTIVQANAIQANADDGIFKILTVGLTVTFQDMTIQNGNALSSSGSTLDVGGAVYIKCNAATNISFEQVTLTNNKSVGDRGGAVYITDDGTGQGTVSFTNCVISNNEATSSNGDGGGIANLGADNFTMTKCTVSGNIAGDDGGGIYALETGAVNKFINCTMYNNTAGISSADQARGGLAFLSNTATYEFYNCTIVDNNLTTAATRQGAGLYHTSASDLSLTNTIVANNTGATSGNDIYANSTGNLIQTTSLVEECVEGSGSCPSFSYWGDPSLIAVATCGEQAYFAATNRSFIHDNGTMPTGDIPTDDICGTTRSAAKYDIGAYDDNVLSTGLVATTSDLETYFGTIINNLPDDAQNNFTEPTVGNLTTWNSILTDILADNTTTAHTTAMALDYEVILLTDNSTMRQYYLLQKTFDGANNWGTYIFNPTPCREIVLEAPHPIHDSNTGNQGIYCFKNTDVRAFLLTGTHRCNSTTASSCDGTTTACGASSNFKISDMAHNSNNCFQATSNKLHDDIATTVLVQLHGFSKNITDPYVILSNGTTHTPSGTDYAADFKTQLAATDGTLDFKIGHIDNWTRLIGTTNTQGRYINGETVPCTNAASNATGRFIHLEQERTKLRADATGWAKVSTALENMIACVLPVELVYFKANVTDNKTVVLQWQTASEINNKGFEIQRSIDGENWDVIDFIEGYGISQGIHNYHFIDKKPFPNTTYYRLKQIDDNGTFEYSKTVQITVESLKYKAVEIFPNPVQSELNIINGVGKVIIYNMLGQVVRVFEIKEHNFKLNTENFPKGQYTLQLERNGTIKRFVK